MQLHWMTNTNYHTEDPYNLSVGNTVTIQQDGLYRLEAYGDDASIYYTSVTKMMPVIDNVSGKVITMLNLKANDAFIFNGQTFILTQLSITRKNEDYLEEEIRLLKDEIDELRHSLNQKNDKE